ncbi:MAG: anti-sigma-D factor RsdA [Actinophytocola sp.]|uniref:anti-sigma-D factor RsdA n=1 Tax=Actinophytocola sp. TaxID=1872138 RepID=UPI003C7843FB
MSDRRDHAKPELTDFDENADTEAIDLALVHADDEYLDLLGGSRLVDDEASFGEFGDERLTELLMSWRRDVDAEPIGDLVDTKLATVTVHAARMRKKRRPRLLVPVAAAAAVLAIAFAGIGLAARDAQPGDTLWALSKVLYSERARSVEAAETVKQDLAQARAALTEGNVEVAKSKLEEANDALPTVMSEDGKDELEAQHQALLAQLPGSPSGDPGAPPVPDPSTQPDPGTDGSSSDENSSDPEATNPPDTTSPSIPPDTSDTPSPPTTEPTTETSRSDPHPGSGTPSGGGETGGEPANIEGSAADESLSIAD